MLLWIFVYTGMSGFLIKVRMRCDLSQIEEQSDADCRMKCLKL
ncbi:hypothetical protein HMPREF0971_02103 [Segatella oris F0302]|uniref:Uncharacterized protein n=1 Tax=Segatella oris F0302 TaxID=649760 RepID=D1QSY1_9BACT|nr:hypothetical protein HMPREF0971_02103 [Segatella oris F0302]